MHAVEVCVRVSRKIARRSKGSSNVGLDSYKAVMLDYPPFGAYDKSVYFSLEASLTPCHGIFGGLSNP